MEDTEVSPPHMKPMPRGVAGNLEHNLAAFLKGEHLIPRIDAYHPANWEFIDEAFFWTWQRLRAEHRNIVRKALEGHAPDNLAKAYGLRDASEITLYNRIWLECVAFLEAAYSKFERRAKQLDTSLIRDALDQIGIYYEAIPDENTVQKIGCARSIIESDC